MRGDWGELFRTLLCPTWILLFPLTARDLKFMTHPGGNVDSGDFIHRGVTHRLLWQEHKAFGVVSRHPRAILRHAHIVLIPVLPEEIKRGYYCTNELNVCLRLGNQINIGWWTRSSSFWHTAAWLLKMNLDIYLKVWADAAHKMRQAGRFRRLKWDKSKGYRSGSSHTDRVCSVYPSPSNGCVLTSLWKKKPPLLCRNHFSYCILSKKPTPALHLACDSFTNSFDICTVNTRQPELI